jgi:hypothetical protein
MQGDPVDMARRNANVMKTFLLGMFYSPMLPIVWPITILGLIGEYWVAKYLLLRRHSRPGNLGNQLDEVILRGIKIGALLFAVSNFFFHYEQSTDTIVPGLVGIGIAVVSIFQPFSKIRLIRKELRKLREYRKS